MSRIVPLVVCLVVAAMLAANATAGTRHYVQHFRWPAQVGGTTEYSFSLKVSGRLQAISATTYGVNVPRGMVFDNIVACVHRSPAFLDWDWAKSGRYIVVKVKMITGGCRLGPTVAGKAATVIFSVRTQRR